MRRWRWLLHITARSLRFRRGRSLLLVTVVAMAVGVVVALAIVSTTMTARVTEELNRYGANIVVSPAVAPVAIGTGRMSFGSTFDRAWLDGPALARLFEARKDVVTDYSLHLRSIVRFGARDVVAEGVDFTRVRRLFPWWQIKGRWPADGEAVVGTDLAAAAGLQAGSRVAVQGAAGTAEVVIAAIVSTGGDEDKALFLTLDELQKIDGVPGRISEARVTASAAREPLSVIAARLQRELPGAEVREVRQVARTSEELLRKVQLLMALVAAVVVVTCAGSVTGTMSTTVLERSREIGLLKAIGGSRGEVFAMFSFEAAIFGVAGGCVGYLVGVGIAAVVMTTVFGAGPVFHPVLIPAAAGAGLLLVFVGSVASLLAVFRLDPVQSLRGE